MSNLQQRRLVLGARAARVPRPVHDADFISIAASIGSALSTIANKGSDGRDFTSPASKEFLAASVCGMPAAYSDVSRSLKPASVIPVNSSYTILAAMMTLGTVPRVIYTQYQSTNFDILAQGDIVYHYAGGNTSVNFGGTIADPNSAFALAITFDATTLEEKIYVNGLLYASGTIGARSRTPNSAAFNNQSSTPTTSGMIANWMAAKVWNQKLYAAQVFAATEKIRSRYGVKWSRYAPAHSGAYFALWADSTFAMPNPGLDTGEQLAALFSPSREVYNGSVAGYTSTQIKSAWQASAGQVRRNAIGVVCAGRNNADDIATVLADVDAIVSGHDNPLRVIVVPTMWTSAGAADPKYASIVTLKAAMNARYGDRCLDLQNIIMNPANTTDDYHYTEAGSALAAAAIKAKAEAMGFI